MYITVSQSGAALGVAAAKEIISLLNKAIEERGEANCVLSTGASQFSTFDALLSMKMDWSSVNIFHLDEYIGLAADHPASFERYLKERFLDKVSPKRVFFVRGTGDVAANMRALEKEISEFPTDVGVIGLGENAHIAFNDPPADFEIDAAYHIVTLNDACKRQQVGEGWFSGVDEVPSRAISMTPKQIMRCRHIVAPVPDVRKAQAIFSTLSSPRVDPMVPATLLTTHPDFHLFLDADSASLCSAELLQNATARKA